KTKASAVLVDEKFEIDKDVQAVLIFVKDVHSTLISLIEKFSDVLEDKTGIEEPVFIGRNVQLPQSCYIGAFAYLGENSKIGQNVKIYPNCYIGEGVTIGENTILYAGTKIYSNCEIGNNCIIHSGAVIGSDGFGHLPQADGSYKKIPHVGKVIIRDHVEIGANTTIDRATIEATIIQRGVKLDNQIQIAHNVEIGENTVIAAQTGVSGSTKIGKRCVIGGQVGFVGHIEIADGSQFGAKSGVAASIKEKDGKWFGIPLLPVHETLRLMLILKKLPELYKTINTQQREIEELKKSLK
ncbi:UDP-3-O-(3-hydroxymyristoyl)glucosamine N-acyltransferase, partial [Bacteroidota bacterium]